jgi:hypothetical protein
MRYVRFDFGHNYNKTSREAVYAWFNRWLLNGNPSETITEKPYVKEPDAELRVWREGQLPTGAKTDGQVTQYLIDQFSRQVDSLFPKSREGLETFRRTMFPAWKHTLQLDWPVQAFASKSSGNAASNSRDYVVTDPNRPGSEVRLQLTEPQTAGAKRYVLLAQGLPSTADSSLQAILPEMDALAAGFLSRGWGILRVLSWTPEIVTNQFDNFFTVYNRTKAQSRVADLTLACAFARSELNGSEVVLCGQGAAGPWALLSAPAADGVIADCSSLDYSNDSALLGQDLFFPGIRRIQAFETAAVLATPHRLLLHGVSPGFAAEKIQHTYKGLSKTVPWKVVPSRMSAKQIVDWL